MNAMRDAIRRSVEIHAPIQRVWELVSEPGWWINQGELVQHRIEYDGDTCVVHDEALGAFPLGIDVLEPPHRAVFTWLAGEQGGEGARTRTEFVLEENEPGTVVLTVTESGFAAMTPEQYRRTYDDNVEGWELELGVARDALEGAGQERAGA
ncbi:ATPase [Brachybacterium endophyticum]|uniref:ATPase n=1 Tax=Brachybacterium endophyticum TaxID=2182385 RepID=A0A2U2RJE5_9MICO|nr:SRPBCC domain-containing protein [Brachybacterium endophyticum]PWH05980.1 ATPase [Brachybacterium endophyticum]